MKRKFGLFVIVLVLGMMAACGKKDQGTIVTDDIPQPIAVDFTVTEEVAVDDIVEMAAVVTHGDDKVDDADEVVFEVWEEGKKDESVMIESKNNKEGLYTAETSFNHDGLFHIQVHVTARAMHTMPIKEVVVGNGGNYEEQAEGEHEHGHGHSEGFSMHFTNPENVQENGATELVVHIEVDGEPLEQARVRYEIWNEANADKRDWIEVEETEAGQYAAAHTFVKEGTYQIQIHVEDEKDLHEHEQFTIEVGK